MEEIHIGQQIKLVLENKGISVTEFAKRIIKSRENIYSIFNRKSIDTALLIKISEVLEFDFFSLYSKTTRQLQKQVDQLLDENQLLKEYNALLKGVKK
jgi:hypothetical protein